MLHVLNLLMTYLSCRLTSDKDPKLLASTTILSILLSCCRPELSRECRLHGAIYPNPSPGLDTTIMVAPRTKQDTSLYHRKGTEYTPEQPRHDVLARTS